LANYLNLDESTIFRANEKLASVQKSRESEIAKLHAIQRKAEMRVTTLERTVEEKSRENRELTQICDELIAKVGK
jgi:transforming acidic coiled-coil-containing protein 3